MRFLAQLLGLSKEQFSPILVRAARVFVTTGGSAAIGAILEGLGVVEWSSYLSEEQVPIALIVAGAIATLLEGLADWLKQQR